MIFVTRNKAIHKAEREKDITLQVVIQSWNLQKGERKVIAKTKGIENLPALLLQVDVPVVSHTQRMCKNVKRKWKVRNKSF